MTGHFSLAEAGTRFLVVAAGGIWSGWLLDGWPRRCNGGWMIPRFRLMSRCYTVCCIFRRVKGCHVSGILAVVIAGMVYGWYAPRNPEGTDATPALRFGNGCLCPEWSALHADRSATASGGPSLPASSMAQASSSRPGAGRIVLFRFAWMFASIYLPRLLSRTFRHETPWQHTVLIAWTGMRGADSLPARWPFLRAAQWSTVSGRDLILLLTSASFSERWFCKGYRCRL